MSASQLKRYRIKDKNGNTKDVTYDPDCGLSPQEFLKVEIAKFNVEKSMKQTEALGNSINSSLPDKSTTSQTHSAAPTFMQNRNNYDTNSSPRNSNVNPHDREQILINNSNFVQKTEVSQKVDNNAQGFSFADEGEKVDSNAQSFSLEDEGKKVDNNAQGFSLEEDEEKDKHSQVIEKQPQIIEEKAVQQPAAKINSEKKEKSLASLLASKTGVKLSNIAAKRNFDAAKSKNKPKEVSLGKHVPSYRLVSSGVKK